MNEVDYTIYLLFVQKRL